MSFRPVTANVVSTDFLPVPGLLLVLSDFRHDPDTTFKCVLLNSMGCTFHVLSVYSLDTPVWRFYADSFLNLMVVSFS
jgi:hypothetical protein